MSLIYAGIECELREVSLSDKPIAMLEISPKGSVPVLQMTDGNVLEESLDIMLWALLQSDAQSWLKPSQGSTDDMQSLIERNDGEFKYHLDRYKYPSRYDDAVDPQGFSLMHREKACDFLNALEERLEKNNFLFGNSVALADVAIFPFVRQFAATDKGWFVHTGYPHLKRWLQHWLDCDLFQQAMSKQLPWQPGDTPVMLAPQT